MLFNIFSLKMITLLRSSNSSDEKFHELVEMNFSTDVNENIKLVSEKFYVYV